MAQPMSTPTAAGVIAPLVGDAAAHGPAHAPIDVGPRRNPLKDKPKLRRVDELLARLIILGTIPLHGRLIALRLIRDISAVRWIGSQTESGPRGTTTAPGAPTPRK